MIVKIFLLFWAKGVELHTYVHNFIMIVHIKKYESKNNGNNTLSKYIKQIYFLLEMRLGDRLKKIFVIT